MWRGVLMVGRGLNDTRLKGYAYIWANLAFILFCLPIISAPAAYSALQRVAHVSQTSPSDADLAMFWETLRANFWRALPWGLANLAFLFLTFSNFLAYNTVEGATVQLLRFAWAGALFLWAGVLLYTWPIYYEMLQPSVWGATRNAIVMTLRNPAFTFAILLCILLLSVISTALTMFWVLLTWGAIAAIANAAVLDRLAQFRAAGEAEA